MTRLILYYCSVDTIKLLIFIFPEILYDCHLSYGHNTCYVHYIVFRHKYTFVDRDLIFKLKLN